MGPDGFNLSRSHRGDDSDDEVELRRLGNDEEAVDQAQQKTKKSKR